MDGHTFVSIVEGETGPVADFDCGEGDTPDTGVELCALKDKDLPEDNKPVSLTLTYAFGTEFDQLMDQDSDKRAIVTNDTDDDGEVYIRVLDKDGDVLFEGTVQEGESFEVDNGGKKFDSETHVEIYDSDGGALLQQIEFHTSCSQPLAIGDTFGSISLAGAT